MLYKKLNLISEAGNSFYYSENQLQEIYKELEEFLEKPMSNVEMAFSGAFIKNHKKVKQTTIDEIYKKLKGKKELIVQLQKMISECYESLLEEPEEDDEGNATWEVVDLSPEKSQK